jgi:hypothetical protein
MKYYSYVFQTSLKAIPFVIGAIIESKNKKLKPVKSTVPSTTASRISSHDPASRSKNFYLFLSGIPDILYPLFGHLQRVPVSVFRHLHIFKQFLLILKFRYYFNDKFHDISVNTFVLHSSFALMEIILLFSLPPFF